MGVFPTAEAARRAKPPALASGYDSEAAARMYDHRIGKVFSYDYPVLFWLRDLLKGATTVADIGGHNGLAYYSYASYLTLPEQLQWTVVDLPQVVAYGQRFAREKGRSNLHFSTDFGAASGADILLAAGSAQCFDDPSFTTLLGRLSRKPRHVLINKILLHPQWSFFTLFNIGTGVIVLSIHQRDEFIKTMDDLGYALRDSWDVPEYHLYIPFHPEHLVPRYAGLYFQLKQPLLS